MTTPHLTLTSTSPGCTHVAERPWEGATQEQLTQMAALINGEAHPDMPPSYALFLSVRPHRCPTCAGPLSATVGGFTP